MSEINELKEKLIVRRIKWMRAETTLDYMVSDMTDLLIGITEHLEAAEERREHIDENGNLIDVGAYAQELRRAALIEALRWVRPHAPYADMNIKEYVSGIDDAITRLENGGDL